jgi:xylosylprotein 4-beta-galactosyltransferase
LIPIISTERQDESIIAEEKSTWGPHVLGIVVPYRNRFEELLDFAPHMHKYLNEKKIRHRIFIINQVDKLR